LTPFRPRRPFDRGTGAKKGSEEKPSPRVLGGRNSRGMTTASDATGGSALRAALLGGTLSVRVSEVDVRRDGGGGAGGALPGPIETDYILRVSGGGGGKSPAVSHSCSKRYVDLRLLSARLRRHAERAVAHHNGGGSGHHGTAASALAAGLGRMWTRGTEAVQFLTNTEGGQGGVASGLDSAAAGGGPPGLERRPSEMLRGTAPRHVRGVLVGVDEFHESIFSERRQFGSRKTNYDHVRAVAGRRRGIVDGAFEKLLGEVGGAGLPEALRRGIVSPPLTDLVGEIETFLLTDAVDCDGEGEEAPGAVSFVSTRHRQSLVVREEEERTIREAGEVVVAEEAVEKGDGGPEESASPQEPAGGLLPDDPLDFAVVFAAGTVLLKLAGGRSVSLGLDAVIALCVACGTGGYLLRGALRPAVPAAVKGGGVDAVGEPSAAAKAKSPPPQDAPAPRPTVPSRRDLMQRSANRGKALSLKSQESLDLIQGSLRSTRRSALHINDKAAAQDKGVGPGPSAAEEKAAYPVVETRTLERFPDGAPLGSHLNMFSAPPASNFRVRGPDYLADRRKVPSADYPFDLRGCDLFLTDDPPTDIGRHPSLLAGRLRDVPTMIVSFRLPWGVFLSYYAIPDRFLPFLRRGAGHGDPSVPLPSTADMTPGERTLCDFLLADGDERNEVLKIVPVAVEAPWIVKRVVNGSPALVGKKMPIEYIYGPPDGDRAEYFEIDLDIVSSAAARNILAVVRSYTKELTIDLGFVVQANRPEDLPETMCVGVRIHGIDPLTAELLPEFDRGDEVPGLTEQEGEED